MTIYEYVILVNFIEFPMMSPDYKRNLRKKTSKMKTIFRESFAKLPRSIRESSTSADKPMGFS